MHKGSDDRLTQPRRGEARTRIAMPEADVWERHRQRAALRARWAAGPFGVPPADVMSLVVWTVACLGAGVLGSIGMTPEAKAWAASLAQPSFSLPAAVYAPVWTMA